MGNNPEFDLLALITQVDLKEVENAVFVFSSNGNMCLCMYVCNEQPLDSQQVTYVQRCTMAWIMGWAV